MWLNAANQADQAGRQAFHGVQVRLTERQTRQAIDRIVTGQVLAQCREVHVHAAEFMDQEQRRLRAAAAHRYHCTVTHRCIRALAQHGGHTGHTGVLEQLGQSHLQAGFIQQVDQSNGQQ